MKVWIVYSSDYDHCGHEKVVDTYEKARAEVKRLTDLAKGEMGYDYDEFDVE